MEAVAVVLAVDRVHCGVAWVGVWDVLALEGAGSESDLIRGASAADDLSLALSGEESLNLVENVRQLKFGLIE